MTPPLHAKVPTRQGTCRVYGEVSFFYLITATKKYSRDAHFSEEQIECHGEIAISTLNRKFALTSDVEPCLITRFNFAEEKQLSFD